MGPDHFAEGSLLETRQSIRCAPLFYSLRNALSRVVGSRLWIKNQVGSIRVTGKRPEPCQQFTKLRIRSTFVGFPYFFDEADKFGFSVFRYFYHVRSLFLVLADVISRGVDAEVIYAVDSAAVYDPLDMVYFKYTARTYSFAIPNRGCVA
ncbi:hypothetical protein PS941_02432 [Pseudomonas fluorescens]|uniref:Uncharacterized protein n=1 Tax=Pseudomonas fluorescens TaxID=294 RepID=A0A5E7TNS5_PSEFL|nr:hypothetical protein PS941_02432 [Pseudomonas fluorescens]